MKNLFKFAMVLATMFTLYSCSVETYVSKVTGDITWMNDNGEVVNSWNNALLQSETTMVTPTSVTNGTIISPYKIGGWLSFTTEDNKDISLFGGMVIIENMKSIEEKLPKVTERPEATALAEKYKSYKEEIARLKDGLNTTSGLTKEEKKKIKEQISNLETEAYNTKTRYYEITGGHEID